MTRDYNDTQLQFLQSTIVANDCVCRIQDSAKTNLEDTNTWKIGKMKNLEEGVIGCQALVLQCYDSFVHGADADCVPIVILIIICVALAISVFYLYRKVKKMKKELDDIKRDTQINKNVPVERNDEDVKSKEIN